MLKFSLHFKNSKIFFELHRLEVLDKYGPKYLIGKLENEEPKIKQNSGDISKVPYAEASVWLRWHSPYYSETHRKFKVDLRKFFDEHILPEGKLFPLILGMNKLRFAGRSN